MMYPRELRKGRLEAETAATAEAVLPFPRSAPGGRNPAIGPVVGVAATPGSGLKNNLMVPFNRILKRSLDICAGSVISIVAIPLVLLLSVLIRLDSPGPAIFVAKWLGCNGKEFNCYKFRTMYLNNDQIFKKYLEGNPGFC